MSPAIDLPLPAPTTLPPPSRQRFARPQPVPASLGVPVHVRDGRTLHLRPITPADVAAMRRCFARLPAEDVRRRFLHPMSELPEPMAQRMCRIDPACEAAFVLMDETHAPAEMRGVGRIYVDEASDSAEFSVLVERDWSRLGLGALLMGHLLDECRRRGLAELWGYVLIENRPMLEFCRRLGFTTRLMADEPGTSQVSLRL